MNEHDISEHKLQEFIFTLFDSIDSARQWLIFLYVRDDVHN